jgi:hypothetical protein
MNNAPCDGVVVVTAADGGIAAETKRQPMYRSQGTGNLANQLEGMTLSGRVDEKADDSGPVTHKTTHAQPCVAALSRLPQPVHKSKAATSARQSAVLRYRHTSSSRCDLLNNRALGHELKAQPAGAMLRNRQAQRRQSQTAQIRKSNARCGDGVQGTTADRRVADNSTDARLCARSNEHGCFGTKQGTSSHDSRACPHQQQTCRRHADNGAAPARKSVAAMNPASTGSDAPGGGVVVVTTADGGGAVETRRDSPSSGVKTATILQTSWQHALARCGEG